MAGEPGRVWFEKLAKILWTKAMLAFALEAFLLSLAIST